MDSRTPSLTNCISLHLPLSQQKKKNVHAEVLAEGAARNMAPTIDMMANGALK